MPEPLQNTTQGRDPAAEAVGVADLFLLLRLVLADGEADAPTMAALRRVAASTWGLDDEEVDQLLGPALQFGATATAQAISLFRSFDAGRRRMLAAELSVIASRDEELARREERFKSRLLEILDLRPGEQGFVSAG